MILILSSCSMNTKNNDDLKTLGFDNVSSLNEFKTNLEDYSKNSSFPNMNE